MWLKKTPQIILLNSQNSANTQQNLPVVQHHLNMTQQFVAAKFIIDKASNARFILDENNYEYKVNRRYIGTTFYKYKKTLQEMKPESTANVR